MATLTTFARKSLPKKPFTFPKRTPASKFVSPPQKAVIKSKAKAKFPNIGQKNSLTQFAKGEKS